MSDGIQIALGILAAGGAVVALVEGVKGVSAATQSFGALPDEQRTREVLSRRRGEVRRGLLSTVALFLTASVLSIQAFVAIWPEQTKIWVTLIVAVIAMGVVAPAISGWSISREFEKTYRGRL